MRREKKRSLPSEKKKKHSFLSISSFDETESLTKISSERLEKSCYLTQFLCALTHTCKSDTMKFSSIITNYSWCWFVLSSLWSVSFNYGVSAADSTSDQRKKNLKLLLDDEELFTMVTAEKQTYSSSSTTKTKSDDEESSQLHRHLQMLPPGVDPFIGYLLLSVSSGSHPLLSVWFSILLKFLS